MIGKLIWKEWSEQRWKLFLGCVLLGGFTAIGLQARVVPDMAVIVVAVFYAIIFPLLASMDVVAAERADGTLKSLLSLPVPAWKILAVKIAVGLAVCLGPLILTAGLACAITGGRESTYDEILRVYAGSALLTSSMFIWMLAFGIRQPSEGRAAVAGMIAFGVLLLPIIAYQPVKHALPQWVAGLHPFSLMFCFVRPSIYGPAFSIAVQAVISAGLFFWAARRLAKEGKTA